MTILHNVDGVRFSGHTTDERDVISAVARERLLILNTDTGQFEFYIDGQGWRGILRLEADGTITPIHHGEFVNGDLHVEYARTAAPEEITTGWLLKSGGSIRPKAGDPPEGEVGIQRKTSTGAPTHSAGLGTLCWVQPDDYIYVNNDGDTGWTKQARSSDLHTEVHGSAGHTGIIGERQVEILIPLTNPLPSATANATQDDDYLYKKPYNAARRINKWYIRFAAVLAAATTFELRKNGTLITGASIAISASARDATIDSFTETTLADGDYLEVWQTVGNAEAIGGRAYVYGDEDIMAAIS